MPRALAPDGTAGRRHRARFKFRAVRKTGATYARDPAQVRIHARAGRKTGAVYARGPAQVRIHARASRRRDRPQDNEHELYREGEKRQCSKVLERYWR